MRLRRAICLAIIAVMYITTVTACRAEENDVPPVELLEYTYTEQIAATLTISGNRATASGMIIPHNSQRTSVTVYLQRSTTGTSGWTSIGSWSGSSSGGTSEASGSKTISKGYYYRTYVVGKVYDSAGNVIETVTKTSSKKHY